MRYDFGDFRIFIAWKFFPGAALSRYPWAENFLKSSSKHFVNGPGHGVVLGWQRLYPPSEVEIASSFPLKSYKKGPNKASTVCVVFSDILRHQRNAQKLYCGNLKHPLGLSRNSAANRSIQLRCMRLMHCLFSQDSTKSLGSKKNFKPAMAPARFTTRWAPTTVDGRKILHQLIGWLSRLFPGFFYILCGAGVLPSTV